jgi:DNA primase
MGCSCPFGTWNFSFGTSKPDLILGLPPPKFDTLRVPQISRETTEQILAATDIVDLIGSYIEVKRSGTKFVALCPFHNEKSPSFNINQHRQFFHCFGCKKSGDAITFVREYENLTFTDAVKKLASRAGIAVVEEAVDPKEDRARRQRGRQLDVHREVAGFLHQMLFTREATHAREYMKSRGFGKEMAERWMIGWMPEDPRVFMDWAREKKLTGRELVDAGIFVQKEQGGIYVRFRDRLMFPIRNEHGDVIAFSGRQLREDPRSGKYINSPETVVFKKSHVLFALERARKAILTEKAVVICEGQVDTICCHEQGIENVVGTQGTALTTHHAKLLRRYAKNVILCFDSDKAGQAATVKAFEVLAAEGLPVRVARMPVGEDPDSFMKAHGADGFREILAESVDFFDFRIDRAAAMNELGDLQQRSNFARTCARELAFVGDAVAREGMINHVATRLRTGVPELRDAVLREIRFAKNKPEVKDRNAPLEPEKIEPIAMDPLVGYLCSLALHSGSAQDWLGEQYETLHEAAEDIEGVPVLESILSARPDPASPASVNAFLAAMPEPYRLALHADSNFHSDPPEHWQPAAEEAVARVSAKALLRRDARVTAELSKPDLTPADMTRLLQEAKLIHHLISGLDQRFIFNDRFAPVRKAEKKPFFRTNNSGSRPQNNP